MRKGVAHHRTSVITTSRVAAVLATCVPAFPGTAQSINIDYGDAAGVPPADYAAAGLPGAWNAVTVSPGVAVPLVDLLGQPTAATATYDFGGALFFDDPATTGDDERLLDDGVGDVGDVMMNVQIEGLMAGTYQVITYGWTPGMPNDSTLVIVDGLILEGSVIGGPWPGELQEGVTHAVHEAQVTKGLLTIGVVGGYFGAAGFLNGLQLVRITPADIDRDGMVGIGDFLGLLGQWGPCGAQDACTADIDDDDAVGITDLLMLLADWG